MGQVILDTNVLRNLAHTVDPELRATATHHLDDADVKSFEDLMASGRFECVSLEEAVAELAWHLADTQAKAVADRRRVHAYFEVARRYCGSRFLSRAARMRESLSPASGDRLSDFAGGFVDLVLKSPRGGTYPAAILEMARTLGSYMERNRRDMDEFFDGMEAARAAGRGMTEEQLEALVRDGLPANLEPGLRATTAVNARMSSVGSGVRLDVRRTCVWMCAMIETWRRAKPAPEGGSRPRKKSVLNTGTDISALSVLVYPEAVFVTDDGALHSLLERCPERGRVVRFHEFVERQRSKA